MRRLSLLLCALFLVACATPPPKPFAEVDYGMGEERDVVVDGVRLRVREGGPRDAPTLVLLHCFGLSMKVWRDLVPLLEERYHVIAYDAVGHGKSARGVRRITFPMLARLGLGVMDALGVEKATLVGNSMGGATALHMALAAPERVEALVLIDAAGLKDSEWFIPLWPLIGPRHLETAAPWTWQAAYYTAVEKRSPLVDEIAQDLEATRGDRPLRTPTALQWHSAVDTIFSTDREQDLPRIAHPTLVLAGRHDRIVTLDHAERLAKGIRGSRYVVFEDLGHLPEIEDAEQVAAEVLPFLEKALAHSAR